MYYEMIRSIFFIILVVLFFSIRRSTQPRLKTIYIVLFVVVLAIRLFDCFCTLENLFITFNTPEAAYQYMYNDEIIHLVDGQKSTLVVAQDEEGTYSYSIIPKTQGGYLLNPQGASSTTVVSDKASVTILEEKQSNDSYIYIWFYTQGAYSLSDNYNSKFINIDQEVVEQYNIGNRIYCAYIGTPDENYQIIIDGIAVYPIQSTQKVSTGDG